MQWHDVTRKILGGSGPPWHPPSSAPGCDNEAGMSGTKQERSTLQLNAPGLGWLFATLLLQHPNQSQKAASGVRRVMPDSCEVTQGVGDT